MGFFWGKNDWRYTKTVYKQWIEYHSRNRFLLLPTTSTGRSG